MTSTTGQIQIQFNWIFVIIIGSVLLIFFFAIINNQSKTTDDRISISQSKYFQTVLSATGQKAGTLKEYSVPKDLVVEFSCNDRTKEYGYRVQGLDARDTRFDVIFTRELLRGNNIQTWTQEWQVPFAAGTFLYITNSRHGFIFYNFSDFQPPYVVTREFELLYKGFPTNISVDVIDRNTDWDDINDRNYDSYTYIFLKGEEPSDVEFPDKKDITVLVIDPSDDGEILYDVGKIYYFSGESQSIIGSKYREYRNFEGSLPSTRTAETNQDYQDRLDEAYSLHAQNYVDDYTSYLGRASMYGAVFSETKDIYECNMEKAFTRLRLITQLYYFRTTQILDNYQYLSTNCQRALGRVPNSLIEIPDYPLASLRELINRFDEQGFDKETTEEVYATIGNIVNNNQFILGLSNCPAIY